MASVITIPDVPDETVSELAASAARVGLTLEEYVRTQLVAMAGTGNLDSWGAGVRARKAATGGSLDARQILGHRDADRRS